MLIRSRWEGQFMEELKYQRKDFARKLIKLDRIQRKYYNILKSEIMKYQIINRTSKYYDTFIQGNRIICKIGVVGNSLRLYLALNPEEYPIGQFPHKNMSEIEQHEKTPFLMKITNDLSCDNGVKLIQELARIKNLKVKAVILEKDYARIIQFLINKGTL